AASAIAADAAAAGRPSQVFYLPSAHFPACGLAFYLRSPLEGLTLEKELPGQESEPREVARVLEKAPTQEAIQYFAVRDCKANRFEKAASGLARGRWLLPAGEVRIWRREG